jgi:hypothetical protein
MGSERFVLGTGGDKAKQAALLQQQQQAAAAAAAAQAPLQHAGAAAEGGAPHSGSARPAEWQPVVQPAVKRQRSRLWNPQAAANGAAAASAAAAVPEQAAVEPAQNGAKAAQPGRRSSASALTVVNAAGACICTVALVCSPCV